MNMLAESQTNVFRMIVWLIIGLSLYTASGAVGIDHPALQTILYKLGHVTTLAFVGYWISRQMLGRINDNSDSTDRIARAILVGCVILAGSMGL